MKNKQEKSDPSIVAKRPANKPNIAEVDLWASGGLSPSVPPESAGNVLSSGHFSAWLIDSASRLASQSPIPCLLILRN